MLMQANRQWSSRPADQRFTSLPQMLGRLEAVRAASRALVTSNRRIEAVPVPESEHKGMVVAVKDSSGDVMRVDPYAPTHHSFGQLAGLASAPGGYLRTLPAELSADCINYGLMKRDIEDVGVLLYKNGGDPVLRAATGPRYGRIWNSDIVKALMAQFGDGVSGRFKVPGEFGQDVVVTQENTTLYASDRDMFVFLADEKNRIEVPGRRDGRSGDMARGFFLWNSEEGDKTFGLATFLFDYVCCNRIVWGASGFEQITIRHTSSAPDKWLEEVKPALIQYVDASTKGINDAIAAAKSAKLDNVDEWLTKRYSKNVAASLMKIHELEEKRPIENLWDVTTAITAKARNIEQQDARVELEREGGKVLALAA